MTDIERASLLALAERVEGLEGPDRVVDKAILALLHLDQVPSPIVTNGYGWREDSRTPPKSIYPPRYTASLDAAMMLVPDGWQMSRIVWINDVIESSMHCGFASSTGRSATPALALTAAALRAHAGEMK